MRSVPAPPQEGHIYPRIFFPDHKHSHHILPAHMGRKKPHKCSYLQQIMKNPRELSEPPLPPRNHTQPCPPDSGLLTGTSLSYLLPREPAWCAGCCCWKQSSSSPSGPVSSPYHFSLKERQKNFFIVTSLCAIYSWKLINYLIFCLQLALGS